MATDPGFLNHVTNLFTDLGPVRSGRVFGGTSLYIDDAMFGVKFGDAHFMKADADPARDYANAGSEPFRYDTKSGERTIPRLMSLPPSALDDPEEALNWGRRSLVPATKAAQKRQQKSQSKV